MIIDCPTCRSQNRVPTARLTSRARCGQCKTLLSPPDEPLTVRSEAELDELLREAPVPVIVDFWAAWCGPCRAVAPELAKLAHERRGETIVVKVDTEALPALAKRHHVFNIPTMILFRHGWEAKRVSGAMSAQRIATDLAV